MKSILFFIVMVACCSMPTDAAEVSDVHACGSYDAADYPNKPKVRLSFTKSGDRTPAEHSVVFFDHAGEAYFKDFSHLNKNLIEKIWAEAKQADNTFCFGVNMLQKKWRITEKSIISTLGSKLIKSIPIELRDRVLLARAGLILT